jgi:mercuric ion transport protein
MKIKSESGKLAGAGVLSAIAASLCCITPVLAILSGASGAASAFSWMDPFRPYLFGITVLVLGFAWYQKLKPKTAEEIQCACEEDEKPSFWQSKMFLGIVTGFAVLMLAFP